MKRPRFVFTSVRQKLIAGVLLASMVALLVAGGSLFVYDLYTYRSASATGLAVEAERLGNVSTAALQFDDRTVAAQNLGFLKARQDIRSAAIYSPRGAVFASYLRADASPSELPPRPGAEGVTINGDRIEIFRRIVAGRETLGTVYLAQDLGMKPRIASYAVTALAFMLAALGVSALLSNWLQRQVAEPLIHISSLAREVVEKRDYSVRATGTTHDEIGTLVHAFNEMLSEIQRRTEALDESEAGLRRAQALAGLTHVVSDPSGKFVRWSETFPRMVERGEQDMPRNTRAWLAFVHPEDRARFRATAIEAAATRRRTAVEYRLVRAGGSHVDILQVMEPLGGAGSGAGHWFSTLLDVTQQKRAAHLEESNLQLRSANIAKSSFLSTMSHEIRTPMNGVLGMLELLSLSKLDADQHATLDVVRDSGRSLLRIIDDILDFSKIEAGKLEIRPEVASISKVIGSVVAIFSGNASNKALLLKSRTDPRISPAVMVDPLRLQQILNNLVSNAIKFTSKGTIEVRAELVERSEGEDHVRFSVKDTGIGITEEAQARLFQPFAQGGADITRVFGGTGLGLSIARRLAELMGGSMEISSVPGKGTRVSLTLPLPIADPQRLPAYEGKPDDTVGIALRARRRAPSAEQAEREGTLVLVADDHPVNRMVLMRQVEVLGYANEPAENGREALEMWGTGRFGLVITDCNMPELDGYELARAIRIAEREAGVARTPIIACTANALKGEAENCLAAGMDDYIAKPISLNTLLEKLDRWRPIPEGAAETDARPATRSTVPAEPGDPPIDRSVLAAIPFGDTSLEREVLTQFFMVLRDDVAALDRVLHARASEPVAQAAHRIKGASMAIGAFSLAAVAQQLVTAAGSADWEEAALNRGLLHQEADRLRSYLTSLGLIDAELTKA